MTLVQEDRACSRCRNVLVVVFTRISKYSPPSINFSVPPLHFSFRKSVRCLAPWFCDQAGSSPLCLSYLFQPKLPDFVVLRLTGFVFLLLLSSLLQKHKTCRPQSNKIKQFVLEKGREAEGRGAGLGEMQRKQTWCCHVLMIFTWHSDRNRGSHTWNQFLLLTQHVDGEHGLWRLDEVCVVGAAAHQGAQVGAAQIRQPRPARDSHNS